MIDSYSLGSAPAVEGARACVYVFHVCERACVCACACVGVRAPLCVGVWACERTCRRQRVRVLPWVREGVRECASAAQTRHSGGLADGRARSIGSLRPSPAGGVGPGQRLQAKREQA